MIMAADYIRRDDALYAIQRQRGATRSPAQNRLLDLLRVDIVRAPAADVAEVVHGRWILHHTVTGNPYTECSNCCTNVAVKTDKGTSAKLDMRGMPYCPFCSAKMDGGFDDATS